MIDLSFMKDYDLTRYKANPVVTWNHEYYEPPIGKIIFDGGEASSIEFRTPLEGDVMDRGLNAGILMLDPGFIADGGVKKLIEISVIVNKNYRANI